MSLTSSSFANQQPHNTPFNGPKIWQSDGAACWIGKKFKFKFLNVSMMAAAI
jgi:hypothetical protein